jgi:signal transduction histidine kinase
MRLADFILSNTELILAEWEVFARNTLPGAEMGKRALRDHAVEILAATARDMASAQSGSQQSSKSRGHGDAGVDSDRLDGASSVHGAARVGSGFDLMEMVSEYRALRASVLRLWRESLPAADLNDLADITRFNESIDQALAHAVRGYTERIDQSRRMFLAILSHDLRNPLNSIMMSANVIALTGPPDSAQSANQIVAGAKAIAKLIGDLLDFASTGIGAAMPLTLAPTNLQNLCDEVMGEFKAAHPQRRLDFESSGPLTGRWDASRLRQVLSNLIGNALQHGGDGSRILLKAQGTDTDVRLTIHNDGPPIAPDMLPMIFDPLIRGDAASKPRRPGSIGLGLYIAREVATAHGGQITVASTAQSGTTFTVTLSRTIEGK